MRISVKYIKMICSVFISLCIIITSSSCALNAEEYDYSKTAEELAEIVLSHFSETDYPEMDKYYLGADVGSGNYLEPEYAGVLINGSLGTVAEMQVISDYAFFIPSGHRVFEIGILRVSDKKDVESAKKIFEGRLGQKDNGDIRLYNPEEVPLIENAEIITYGNFVILLATTDNEGAKKAFKDAVLIKSTESPNVTVAKYSRNTMYLIGGTCEEGAVIKVEGGTREISSKSDYGNFLVEVPIKDKKSTLLLTAEVPGRKPSKTEKIKVTPQNDVDIFEKHGATATFVGNDYQSIFNGSVPDFTGSNLLDESSVSWLEQRTKVNMDMLKEHNPNLEFIYLIAPNPMNIYAELMPPEYERYTENSLLKQFSGAVTAAGGTVIDLTDTMMAHKNGEFKIYHKTDSHWTDYGAYLGYEKLMTYIGEKFPDAAPRPVSDFRFYNEQRYLGDIFMMLEIEENSLLEYTSFVEFLFSPPGYKNIYKQGNIYVIHEIVGHKHYTNTNLSGNFPSAHIIRDSYGGPIYSFLTDRFSTASWGEWGKYGFDNDEIMNENPDYVITIITERNIANIMYK